MDDDLGVGCFTGIFVAKTSAEGQDTLAESIFAERPSAQVHLMDPLVPEVTVSVFPLPVPIVVEVLTGHGKDSRGAGPEVVVDFFGDIVCPFRSDRVASFVA